MPNNTRKRKVLVIEPDPEFNSILKDFLSSQRFEVTGVVSGDEGLKKYDSFKPDVVLLSREFPREDGGMEPDGLRVLKEIKSDHKRRVPVILTSYEATDADFERYRKLKFAADDFISKPFEDTEIIRRLENLVGFDLSEDMDEINARIEDVMEDNFSSLFDADPDELGISSSEATRREVSRLLEQVGQELERPDEMTSDEPAPLIEGREDSPEVVFEVEPEEAAEEAARLSREVAKLTRQLESVQKKLVTERKRSREIKKEWKTKLLEIQDRLNKTRDREARIRKEFEAMRERFADQELEHTMEIERIHGERRHMEEELMDLRRQARGEEDYSRDKIREDLDKVKKALNMVVEKLEEKDKEKDKEKKKK